MTAMTWLKFEIWKRKPSTKHPQRHQDFFFFRKATLSLSLSPPPNFWFKYAPIAIVQNICQNFGHSNMWTINPINSYLLPKSAKLNLGSGLSWTASVVPRPFIASHSRPLKCIWEVAKPEGKPPCFGNSLSHAVQFMSSLWNASMKQHSQKAGHLKDCFFFPEWSDYFSYIE